MIGYYLRSWTPAILIALLVGYFVKVRNVPTARSEKIWEIKGKNRAKVGLPASISSA